MSRVHVRGREPVALGEGEHLPGRLLALADRSPDEVVLAEPAHGGWRDVTRTQLDERVRAVAAGLVARGVRPGDHVALMSPSRLEWTIADLAILSAGGVTIPLYDTSSPDQCRRIIKDSAAQPAFAATPALADRLEDAGAHGVIVFDDSGLDELTDDGVLECSADACSTACPAAHRWLPGWPSSSRPPGSRSSKATASPRRPRRSPSTPRAGNGPARWV